MITDILRLDGVSALVVGAGGDWADAPLKSLGDWVPTWSWPTIPRRRRISL